MRALLPLLQPFHCRIRVHDPWLPARFLREQGMEPCPLDALLAASRVVFVLAGTVCIQATAPEFQGRVFALVGIAFVGSTPIGAPLLGWIAGISDGRTAMGVGALTCGVVGVLAGLSLWRERSRSERAALLSEGDGRSSGDPRPLRPALPLGRSGRRG